LEEWKKVNADHHNGQGAPDSLGTFTECIVDNGEAMNLEATATINVPYIGETSMRTVEKRWDDKDPKWIEDHIEPTHRIPLAKFEGRKPRLSRMMESILAGFMADISTVTRQLVGQSAVKLLRRDGTGPNTIPCGDRKWRMSSTDVAQLLKAIDKETLKSTVVAESDLPPDVRDLEEIMRPTIIAWLNSFKDKRGVYGGVPENVPAGEPQTAYNLLRWLGHCGGNKNGILRKLYWAIFASNDTLVAKGHGMQEFLDLFGITSCGTYQRLVSSVEVGQKTKFNPSSPTDTSPMDAPFLVERLSGVEFDELEQPDSDLFTKLLQNIRAIFTRYLGLSLITAAEVVRLLWQRVVASKPSLTCLELRVVTRTVAWFRVLRLAKKQNSIPLLQQTHLQWTHHF